MKNYLRSPEVINEKKDKYYIFLAGPIQGAPKWRDEILKIKWPNNVLFLDPAQDGINDFNHQDQVDWETDYLNLYKILQENRYPFRVVDELQ